MDQRRFDSLARSLAAPRSRRGLLGTLAALGAGLATRGAGAQVTQAQCGNKRCAANPGVCSATGCVCCVWSNGNSRCVPPGECRGGVVTSPTTTTTTTTAAPSVCPVVSEVCGGSRCSEANPFCLCASTVDGHPFCADTRNYCDFPCTSDAGCSTGERCVRVAEACSDCPSGSVCMGACGPVSPWPPAR